MNEELKIKVSVDTSGVDAGVAKAKKSLKSLGDSTKASMKGATVDATESFEEMQDAINKIKNLQIFDLLKDKLKEIKAPAKEAVHQLSNFFSKKWWGGALEGVDSFKDALGTIKTQGKNVWDNFKQSATTAIEAIHPKIIALVAAIAGIGVAIKNAFSTASQIKTLNNEAAKIGLSVNAYQEWSYIMQKTGSDADVLGDAIKTLSAEQLEVRKGTEDAIAKFEALGLSMETVMNMSQEELLSETVKRLQNVRNEVERTSLAYRIFGEEDAAQMANVLRLTNAETADLAATVHLLGNTISGDLLAKSQALSGAVSNLKMAWQGLTNTLAELFMPVITTIVNALTKAIVVVNLFLKTIFGLDMTPAASSVGSAAGSVGALTDGLTGAGEAADAATGAVEKLRRATMGFDELNIVSNPKSASSGSGGGSGGGAGGGVDLGGGGFTETESAFDKAKGKIEDFQKKVQAFLDKWKTEIQIIAGALAALGVANLLSGLGKAIGLGDKFLSTMNTIKKLAASAIVIVLQYSLVNEFMDAFIDGEGFKNYILGVLIAAIGTGLLYSMWGPTGIVIGLGVTAVASLQAVFDNGGITNTESAVVALTGLAAALGAVGVAWKLLGLSSIVGGFGTFFTLLREGNGLIPTLAAAFPKLSNAIGKIGPIVSTAGGVIKTAVTTALTGIKTAFTSVISFIIANPITLVIAAIVAFVALIAVKGDEIQGLLNKVSDWLKGIFVRDWREVLGPVFGTIMNGFVKTIGDIFSNVKKIFNGIIDFIRGVFTGDWKRAWEGIKQIFSGIFGGLKAVAKAPINGVISMINGALVALTNGFNWVKKQLNKLSIKVPDWVPKYGGKSFGFNLSMSTAPNIPLLAMGGITTGPTLAGIGERGREAVLPLENNTQWMDMLADRIAARNSTPTKIILKVGERELGEATIAAINQNTRMNGGLKLQLV